MKVKGLKEIKKGAKLYKKTLKLERKLKEESKKYFDAVGFENRDFDYFLYGCKDYLNKKTNQK